ncbi:MAG: alpha/beta fold hydrolase, partial [Acidobacteria bacterium]|nr:alpha/beta fold hydrolase [Acidobacteriota bacterium]
KLDKLDTLEAREFSLPTAGLTPGDYAVQYELLDKDSHVLVSAARDLILDPKLPDRIRSLRAQSEKLALAGVAAKGPLHALAVETVEFVAAQYDAALRAPLAGYVQNMSPLAATLAGFSKPYYSTDSIVPARDLPLAEELAEGLLAGASPLAARKGDLRLAYRSAPDQILVPFRIFLPPAYDPAKKWPLAVVLHGASGDEGSYFERYRDAAGENVTAKLAAGRGYIVLAPNGRGPASFYNAAGAQDVFDAVDRVKAAWSVDEKQVFLTGHSMGAMGTISLSLDARSRFAGFAAVAGVPITPMDYSKAPAVPFLFVHAGNDFFFPTDEVRRFGFVLEKRYKLFEYVEFPGVDHVAVGTASMPKVFDFFDSVRAGAFKPSGKSVPLPSNLK